MMIYTVTFNPSIDYVMFVDDFATGALNRTTAIAKFAGGKGSTFLASYKHYKFLQQL